MIYHSIITFVSCDIFQLHLNSSRSQLRNNHNFYSIFYLTSEKSTLVDNSFINKRDLKTLNSDLTAACR